VQLSTQLSAKSVKNPLNKGEKSHEKKKKIDFLSTKKKPFYKKKNYQLKSKKTC
jgi:hypothetical protein